MIHIREFSDSIANIIERVIDSVVTISTTKITFDIFSFGFKELRGVGSGFAITRDGYIVTNYHVVKDVNVVNIYFRDGSFMEGDVVAVDPYRDLALLKVNRDTKPVSLGDSDIVKIGEIVLAIGSPLGLIGPTVTMGVVSAVGRTIVGENVILEDLIQTDASINPGNSGGPLINTEGKAIGVATAIIPFAQGIGFAIPINSVKRFIDMLNKYGKPVIAWIGVYVTSVNKNLAAMYGLSVDKGVLVVHLIPDSPAYQSGVREGDIIVKANDREVHNPGDLRRVIEDSIDKGYIVLEIVRGKKRYSIEVPLVIETPY